MGRPQPQHAGRRLALAIETSNPTCGARGWVELGAQRVLAGPAVELGVIDDGGIVTPLDAEPLTDGARDDDLMPAISRLLGRADAQPRSIASVGVSIGPGGYTGLRIAVTVATMIARATGASLHPIPTPGVCAWSLLAMEARARPVAICLASKRDTVFTSLLESDDPLATRDIGLLDAQAIMALGPGAIMGDAHLPQSVRDAAGRGGIEIIEPALSARAVLGLAPRIRAVLPGSFTPRYPREPEAVTRWRELHGGS